MTYPTSDAPTPITRATPPVKVSPFSSPPRPYVLWGTKRNGWTHALTGLSEDREMWARCRDFWRDEEGYTAVHVVVNTGPDKGRRITDTAWATEGLPLRPSFNPLRDLRPEIITDETLYVVRGTHPDGRTIDLETLTNANDWTDRLTHWRTPGNAAPYDNNIHVATKTVVTTYQRLDDPANHTL